jgi:hypothetical protein
MLRWFPRLKVVTACFSCSPPDANLVANQFHNCIDVNYPLSSGDDPTAVNNNNNNNNNNKTIENCHIGHCTHTSESSDVEVH